MRGSTVESARKFLFLQRAPSYPFLVMPLSIGLGNYRASGTHLPRAHQAHSRASKNPDPCNSLPCDPEPLVDSCHCCLDPFS